MIKEFQKKYNVQFPTLDKVDVNGPTAAAVYKWLRVWSDLDGEKLDWNFVKFLVNADGEVVGHYKSEVEPKDIETDINLLLA